MGTHPLAGTYTSKEEFINKTLNRLNAIIKEPGIQLRIRNIIGGGDQPWATLELIASAECNNGKFASGRLVVLGEESLS